MNRTKDSEFVPHLMLILVWKEVHAALMSPYSYTQNRGGLPEI